MSAGGVQLLEDDEVFGCSCFDALGGVHLGWDLNSQTRFETALVDVCNKVDRGVFVLGSFQFEFVSHFGCCFWGSMLAGSRMTPIGSHTFWGASWGAFWGVFTMKKYIVFPFATFNTFSSNDGGLRHEKAHAVGDVGFILGDPAGVMNFARNQLILLALQMLGALGGVLGGV